MKAAILGIFTVAYLAVTQVAATPISNSEIVKKQEAAGLDVILSELVANVQAIDAQYNASCSETCSTDQIAAWSQEVANQVNAANGRLDQLPANYTAPDPATIAGLVTGLLVELNATLGFLIGRGGLAGLLGGLTGLVAVLIASLNTLLPRLSNLLDNLLDAVADLLTQLLASLGLTCYLCALGLIGAQ